MARNSAIRRLKPEVSDRDDPEGEGGVGVGSEQGQTLLSSAPLRRWSEYHLVKAWLDVSWIADAKVR